MSKSLNKFLLGCKADGQWVGEELLFPISEFTLMKHTGETQWALGGTSLERGAKARKSKERSNFSVAQYSALCTSKCELYVIERNHFLNKLPKDVLTNLKELAIQRLEFFAERRRDIIKTTHQVHSSENQVIVAHQTMDYHLKKQNPHAGKFAINSLKTHYLKLSALKQKSQSQFTDVSQLSRTLISSSTLKAKKAAKDKLEVSA